MPSARDDDTYADAVSSAIDDIRREVHGALGTRTYRVQIVKRSWSGESVGEGTPSVTVLELDPRPKFEQRNVDRMGPGGRESIGDAVLTEVSLGYTFDELSPKLGRSDEVAYRVIDTGGQNVPDQWFVLAADPRSRRGDNRSDNSDWYIVLKSTSAMSDIDGVEA